MQKNEKRVKTRDDSTKNAKLHKNISNRTAARLRDENLIFHLSV